MLMIYRGATFEYHYKPSYQEDFVHPALEASCYFLGCCMCARRAAFRKHATSLRICGGYLWPASLPKEPMVRRGLEGLTQVGSGVFCTSVFTSGSISEGEGVSLAPAMALCLPGCYLQKRAANTRPSLAVRTRRAHSATDAAGENRIPGSVTGVARRRRGGVSLPAASRGPQTQWKEHQLVLLLIESFSIPDGDVRSPCVLDSRVVTMQRQALGQPNGLPNCLHNRGWTNVMIRDSYRSDRRATHHFHHLLIMWFVKMWTAQIIQKVAGWKIMSIKPTARSRELHYSAPLNNRYPHTSSDETPQTNEQVAFRQTNSSWHDHTCLHGNTRDSGCTACMRHNVTPAN